LVPWLGIAPLRAEDFLGSRRALALRVAFLLAGKDELPVHLVVGGRDNRKG
jgi:hypothetical protein